MRILILGAGGRLGGDLARPEQVRDKISPVAFDLLINCAAMTNVDLCESQREQAFAINAEAPKVLVGICREKKAKLIHFSTDYVFGGEKGQPYVETDRAKPISVYGESKRAGEENVLAMQDRHLVIRVSWVFGPDRPSFLDAMIKRAREEEEIDAVADKFSTPTYTRDIAEMLSRFFDVDVAGGILHFANSGQCSWQEYAQHALDCCHASGVRLKAKTVDALKLADMKNWIARRPVYSVLSTAKYAKLAGVTPRPWRDAVADYIERSYSKK